jgi:hypothetical protein
MSLSAASWGRPAPSPQRACESGCDPLSKNEVSGKLHEAIHGWPCCRWQMRWAAGQPAPAFITHTHTASPATRRDGGAGEFGCGGDANEGGLANQKTRGWGFRFPAVLSHHWPASRRGDPRTPHLPLPRLSTESTALQSCCIFLRVQQFPDHDQRVSPSYALTSGRDL